MSEFVEIRTALAKIQHSQGRIEGTVDALLRSEQERNRRDEQLAKDTNRRLHKLEKRQWFFSGAAATIGAMVGHFLPGLGR